VSMDITRVQALCFDIDGTLSDTDDKWTHTFARILQPLKFLIPGGDVDHLARWLIMGFESPGNWLYGMLDRIGLDDEAAKLINFLTHIRRESVHNNFLLVPGVPQMLASLGNHYPMAVVSARGEGSTLSFLNQYDLKHHFDIIVTGQTCTRSKPFPDPILFAASRMGIPPQQCLMIGDTAVDIRAGRAAGAQTVGVLCGFGNEIELLRAGADLILTSPAELTGLLLPKETG
jgi:N-acetyl-D-muramate 6-phosphate phosphatase